MVINSTYYYFLNYLEKIMKLVKVHRFVHTKPYAYNT